MMIILGVICVIVLIVIIGKKLKNTQMHVLICTNRIFDLSNPYKLSFSFLFSTTVYFST